MRSIRLVFVALLLLLSVYLVGRALAEPWVIDMGDPDSYRLDWGGPSLAGVMAVHILPGVVGAIVVFVAVRTGLRRR